MPTCDDEPPANCPVCDEGPLAADGSCMHHYCHQDHPEAFQKPETKSETGHGSIISGTYLLRHFRRIQHAHFRNPTLGAVAMASFNRRLCGATGTYRSNTIRISRLVTEGLYVMIGEGAQTDRVFITSIPQLEDPTTPQFWAVVGILESCDEATISNMLVASECSSLEALFEQMVDKAEVEARAAVSQA